MFLGVFGLVFWAFALLVAAMASATTAYIRNLEVCMMLRCTVCWCWLGATYVALECTEVMWLRFALIYSTMGVKLLYLALGGQYDDYNFVKKITMC